MRATADASQNEEAREGIGTRIEQVQQDRGLHAGTTTTDTVQVTDRGAGEHARYETLHGSQGENGEHEEGQVQAAGGPSRKDGKNIRFREARHRQFPYTRAAMTQKDCESHKIDYTGVGFETLDIFHPGIGGPSRVQSLLYLIFINLILVGHLGDIVCHTSRSESQSHT